MIGKYHIVIQDKYVKYEFDVKRKYALRRHKNVYKDKAFCL